MMPLSRRSSLFGVPLPVDFALFEQTVSESELGDPLWRVRAYQLGRYLMPLALEDATRLHALPLGRPVASQLWRAACSIPANIAEGYSRSTGADRARFLEYSSGSAREAIVWYDAARPFLGDDLLHRRIEILDQIKRLLNTTIPRARRESLRR